MTNAVFSFLCATSVFATSPVVSPTLILNHRNTENTEDAQRRNSNTRDVKIPFLLRHDG